MPDHENKTPRHFNRPAHATRAAKGKLFFATLLAFLSFTSISARAEVHSLFASSTSAVTMQQARRFGPYATLRRANEVANLARQRGYNAKIIYGYVDYSRAYYVDVW